MSSNHALNSGLKRPFILGRFRVYPVSDLSKSPEVLAESKSASPLHSMGALLPPVDMISAGFDMASPLNVPAPFNFVSNPWGNCSTDRQTESNELSQEMKTLRDNLLCQRVENQSPDESLQDNQSIRALSDGEYCTKKLTERSPGSGVRKSALRNPDSQDNSTHDRARKRSARVTFQDVTEYSE